MFAGACLFVSEYVYVCVYWCCRDETMHLAVLSPLPEGNNASVVFESSFFMAKEQHTPNEISLNLNVLHLFSDDISIHVYTTHFIYKRFSPIQSKSFAHFLHPYFAGAW